MKKFIYCIFGIIILLVFFDFAYYRWGFYIPSNQKTEVISYRDNKELFIRQNDQYHSITIKGVNIGGSIPGKYVTDYAISYDTYYSWLEDIAEMGANTVRLNTIFNDEFYNAFYDFNQKSKNPLYLIQGINLDSYTLNSHSDGYDRKFYGELITQAENAVDVIHGRKKLTLSKNGKGSYKKDISSYVLAYIVGSEWIDDTILYTNESKKEKSGFDGNFIKTKEDATAFETMLAKVMDHLITYETKKYHEQHSISFINSPETDPIAIIPKIVMVGDSDKEYLVPEDLKYYYHKAATLDMDHLVEKNSYKGLFAAYNVSSYYPNYLSYENKEYEDTYLSYLSKLNEHHKMPVLITEFAYSTSRGVSTTLEDSYGNFGGMTEEEQGNAIVKAYHTIIESGSVGGMIATWQDEWDKRSWNTIEKVDIPRSIYWNDVQTTNQGLGILTFDPGKKESICYIDGDIKEWQKKDQVLENEDYQLSMKQDEKYLYFYIKKKNNQENPIYIPMDITKKSGTKIASEYGLAFNRNVDFLMVLNGEEGELFVQEYYNVLKAVNGYELHNKNAYIRPPKKDSGIFESIYLITEPYGTNKFSRNYKKATTVHTGKLTYGNGNPKSKEYHSQADFYEKNGNIEIRIPWQLLNFSDPSKLLIHDDYYKNYGVDSYAIDKMYVGVSSDSDITLEPVSLKAWENKITYHERLKKSYDIIKDDWGS